MFVTSRLFLLQVNSLWACPNVYLLGDSRRNFIVTTKKFSHCYQHLIFRYFFSSSSEMAEKKFSGKEREKVLTRFVYHLAIVTTRKSLWLLGDHCHESKEEGIKRKSFFDFDFFFRRRRPNDAFFVVWPTESNKLKRQRK